MSSKLPKKAKPKPVTVIEVNTKQPPRLRNVARKLKGGCYECSGTHPLWHGPNAQGVAVRHHDATNHKTWVQVDMTIEYGEEQVKKEPPVAEPSHGSERAKKKASRFVPRKNDGKPKLLDSQ